MPLHNSTGQSALRRRRRATQVVERPTGRFDFQGCHAFTTKQKSRDSDRFVGMQPIKSYVVAKLQLNEYSTGVYSNRLVDTDEQELAFDIDAFMVLASIASFTGQEELCNTCRQVQSYCIPLEESYLGNAGYTIIYNLDGSAGQRVEWDQPWDWKQTAQANMGAWYGLQGALNCEDCLLAGCYPLWESRPSNPFFTTLADFINEYNGFQVMKYRSQYSSYGNDFTYMAKNTYGLEYDEWASETTVVMKHSCRLETRTSMNLMNDPIGRNRLCSAGSKCSLCKYGHGWSFHLSDLDSYIENAFDGIRDVSPGCSAVNSSDYFVGWSCSPTGYGIQRTIFLDEECQYPAPDVNLQSVASSSDLLDFERSMGLMKFSSFLEQGVTCDKNAPSVGSGIELRYGIDRNGHAVDVLSLQQSEDEEDFYDAVSHQKTNTICSLLKSGALYGAYLDTGSCMNMDNIENNGYQEASYEVDLSALQRGDLSTLCGALRNIPFGQSQGCQRLQQGARTFEAQHSSVFIDMVLICAFSILACLGLLHIVSEAMRTRSKTRENSLRLRLVSTKQAFESNPECVSSHVESSDESSSDGSCWNPPMHRSGSFPAESTNIK